MSIIVLESGSTVYFSSGQYKLQMTHNKKLGPDVTQRPTWCKCDHSDDLPMTQGTPFNPGVMSGGAKFSEQEKEISLKWMTYLTNFAKSG